MELCNFNFRYKYWVSFTGGHKNFHQWSQKVLKYNAIATNLLFFVTWRPQKFAAAAYKATNACFKPVFDNNVEMAASEAY